MDITLYDETNHLDEKTIEWMEELLQFSAKRLKITGESEVSITFVSNEKIKEINREYRDKDAVTDVISFAVEDEDDIFMQLDMEDVSFPRDLGDIFISYDRAVEQAKDYAHSVDRELGFLLVHGFLHLNGFDHMTESDEKTMFGLQEEILNEYGLKR